MNAFGEGLEVTAIGMVLVFLSLVIVAVLIWALDKVFPGSRASGVVAARAAEEPVALLEPPSSGPDLSDQAAAIAVSILRMVAPSARSMASAGAGAQRSYPAMPWERPAEFWGDDLVQGETITVLTMDPGTGEWKSQGRLASME